MKHDAQLMKALLLNVRDGGHEHEVNQFPEPLVLDQCAYLIDAGYVDGRYIKGSEGEIASTMMTRLLPRGHDFLSELEKNQTATTMSRPQVIRVFVSHSSADGELAAALIDLLRDALALPPEQIRCTSVDGYRLPSGANTNEQLRAEIHETEIFVALLTEASISSTYVLFELGARWGAGRHWALLTARGLTGGHLREPLKSHNALDTRSEAQIDQFLAEIADRLRIRPAIRSAWGAKVKRLAELASAPSPTSAAPRT